MHSYKICLVAVGALLASNLYAESIMSHEYYLPYKGKQKIHLKEKKLASTQSGKVLVLVNSLSIPSLSAFDVKAYSLMDSFAKKGYDVWGIDFIGEGKSSYPLSMNTNPAPVGVYPLRAQDAVEELSYSITYIMKKTGKKSIAVLGWSWGSAVGAIYAIKNPQQIDHLVMYGAMYSSPLAESNQSVFIKPYEDKPGVFNSKLPAYQNIPWKVINSHWKMMTNGNLSIVNESTMVQVGKAYSEIDPKPGKANSLRRPVGPMVDLFAIWHGRPIYDIGKLTTPTLVIYGDQDIFADHALYSKLTKVKTKQEIKIKEATHWLIYEKTRTQFVDDVILFLNK